MILQARQRPSESITIAPTTPFVSILYDKKNLQNQKFINLSLKTLTGY